MEIKKIKDWLNDSEAKKTPQFDIIFEDKEGIKEVFRLQDKIFFSLNVDYPALRGDYFRFKNFSQDRIAVDFEIEIDGEIVGVGYCPINDIFYKDGFLGCAKLEKAIKELTEGSGGKISY